MHLLLLWLRKTIGVLLAAFGFFAGVVGICVALTFAWLWVKGEALSPGDRRVWQVCGGIGVGGALACWAGVGLLRSAGVGPGRGGSFRLQLTGPQRRRSVNAARSGTLVWLFVAAECCFIFGRGGAAAKFQHAAEGALAAYFGYHAIILLHELGHLGSAAALGMDLQKLQVGTGPVLLKGRLGGLRVEWRAWLGGGLVLTADRRERGWRWRHWVYVAAGPACTAGGCLALAGWIEARHQGGSWFTAANGVADVVAMYLLVHSALLWLLSMRPSLTRVGAVRAHTDGWQLLHVPRFDADKVRAMIVATCVRRVELLWEDGRRELAWSRLRALLARYPEEVMLSPAEGHFLDEQGDHVAAAASYERWLRTDRLTALARIQLTEQRLAALVRASDLDAARRCGADALAAVAPEHRAALLDSLATAVLKYDVRAFLPEADAWSQEALALAPDRITLKGTRGAVLVALGRFEEGEVLLREVWITSASETDAAISAFYLGVAAKRHGRGREMRKWLRRSKNLAPYAGKWLVERIARESAPAVRAARP